MFVCDAEINTNDYNLRVGSGSGSNRRDGSAAISVGTKWSGIRLA